MKPREVLALDLHALYPGVDRALRGKYALVISLGQAAKRDWRDNVPHTRYVLAEPLLDELPTDEPLDLEAVRPLAITHWSTIQPAIYFIPDAPLPPSVVPVGKLASPPQVAMYRAYSDWASFAVIRHHEWQHVQKTSKATEESRGMRAQTAKKATIRSAKKPATSRAKQASTTTGKRLRTAQREATDETSHLARSCAKS